MNENMLKKIVIDTIKGEQHLGENLKNLCVDYIEKLQNNWNELKKGLKEDYDYLNQFVMSNNVEFDSEEQMVSAYQNIAKRDLLKNKLDKMQEMENGKDD